MLASVYKLVFNDLELKKLAPSNLEIGTYTTDTVKIVGSCLFYLVHLDTKKWQELTFYVAKNDASVLLSCTTTLGLGLIRPCPRLDYLSPRASLITSSLDHPRKTKRVSVHRSKKEVPNQCSNHAGIVSDAKQLVPKLITSREQILQGYPDVFEGVGCFPGASYHIQIDQSVTPKQTPCRPILVHLKEAFQQEIDKMLKVGVLKPVHEATPWINNFVLVEGKDTLGNLKLRICLDTTNLNKVIVRKHTTFKHWRTLLICLHVPVLCLCAIARKAIDTKSLMKFHPFLQLLTLSLGDLDVLWCFLELQWQEMFFSASWTSAFGTWRMLL